MKVSLSLCLILLSTVTFACKDNDVDGPSCLYEKHGISFSYGDRWHIEEESGWFSEPYVFLETDDSGLIMVLLLPQEDDKTLQQFATEYSISANSQMIMGAFNSEGFNDITSKSQHLGIQEHVKLSIFDEEIPMTRQYFSFSKAENTAYVILQIDDEELNDVAGLDKVLSTFKFIEKTAQ